MKAVKAIYEKGEIKLLEPLPDIESTEVLVIFPDAKEPPEKREKPDPDWEARLFGAGKDWWTDEVDAAIRESWQVRTRPWEKGPGEDLDAPL